MKKNITILLLSLGLSQISQAMVGGGNFSDAYYGCDDPTYNDGEGIPDLGIGACRLMYYTTSLPSIMVADTELDKQSAEYQAITIDQAARTMNGETTLFFGTDKVEAQKYLEMIETLK